MERVISSIYQHARATDLPGGSRFAGRLLPCRQQSPDDFWRAIAALLREARGGVIDGLMPHEFLMLNNGMCRVLAGCPLSAADAEQPDATLAYERSKSMSIAWFDDYNTSVTRAMADCGIDLVLDSENNSTGTGHPIDNVRHDRDYGCPDEVRALIAEANQRDIDLNEMLRSRRQ